MARRARRKHRRRQHRRRGLLPWLGLGALGLATYWMTRRRPSDGPAAPPAAQGPEELGQLPDDAELSWIPGPSGALRVAERHPTGRLPVVFVHGLAGRLEHWTPQLQAVGPALRALALDLPGHGESDMAADGDYSVPALAASLGAVMEGFALRRAIVVAHSLGALAAIEYARLHSDRVVGLLLVDPSGDQSHMSAADRELLKGALERDARGECEMNFRHFLTGARPEVASLVLEDLASTPEEVLLGALEGSIRYETIGALESYSGPVLSMTSELNDSAISLHRLRPDLPVRPLFQASHWLMLDRPEDVLDALWDLLEEIQGSFHATNPSELFGGSKEGRGSGRSK